MTLTSDRPVSPTFTTPPFTAMVGQIVPPIVRGGLWRAPRIAGDLLGAMAVVFSIPFVILAIGLPIALGVRFLLWIAGML